MLNKYIPADFDPKLVPRGSKPKDDLIPVRMMLPFTVQCSTCSSFMYRGRKFNSKKEPVKGSEGKYLGIQRWRFYIKCTACSRPLTFLTDPKNGDYEMESGGTRTYEVHKDKKRVMAEAEAEDAQTEKIDPMKALENRVLASQKEMADLDNLDEIKAMNMRHLKMTSAIKNEYGDLDITNVVLMKTRKKEEIDKEQKLELDEEDEALIKSIKFGRQNNDSGNSDEVVIRLDDKAEEEMQLRRKKEEKLIEKQQQEMLIKAQTKNKAVTKLIAKVKVKRKRKVEDEGKKKKGKISATKEEDMKEETNGAFGLLGGYGSDSDSD